MIALIKKPLRHANWSDRKGLCYLHHACFFRFTIILCAGTYFHQGISAVAGVSDGGLWSVESDPVQGLWHNSCSVSSEDPDVLGD